MSRVRAGGVATRRADMTLSEWTEHAFDGMIGAQLKRRAAEMLGHPDGSCAALTELSGREAPGMNETIPGPTDNTPQARGTLYDAPSTMPATAGRHWFVGDEHGLYCLACALPRRNGRHAPRDGAANAR